MPIDHSHNKLPEQELVPLFIPSLAAILKAKEDQAGRAPREEEVLLIRDQAIVIMVSKEHYLKMEQSRGYKDINPENCFQEWKLLREQF